MEPFLCYSGTLRSGAWRFVKGTFGRSKMLVLSVLSLCTTGDSLYLWQRCMEQALVVLMVCKLRHLIVISSDTHSVVLRNTVFVYRLAARQLFNAV